VWAHAESLEAQTEALSLITKTANDICSIVSHAGNYESLKVKGDVKAELNGLIKQLADLGVSGAADFSSEHFENVLRDQLASTIERNAECKLKVFNSLQEKMIK
jgi:hypothetical protein